MNRSRLSQETTITFNAVEKECIIWSACPEMHKKLLNFKVYPYRQEGDSKWYKLPKKSIVVKNPFIDL